MNKVITFDKSAKREVLKFMDMEVDKEGYIIRKDGGRVLDFNRNACYIDDFAGFDHCKNIIRKDLPSLMKVADKVKDKQ